MEEPEHNDMLPPCGGEADSDPEEEEEEGMGDGKHCTLQMGSTYPWKRQDGTYLPRRQSEWVEETQLASSNSMKEDNMENGADQKTSHIPEDPRSEEEEPEAKKVKMDTSVMVCDDDDDEDDDDDACMACVVPCEDPVMVECGHCFFRICPDKAQENLGIFLCPECKKVVTKKRTERALPYIKCKDHDETLKLYCVDDGDLCCVICRDSLKHNGHRFLHITDAVGVYEAELSSVMSPLVEAWKKTSELTSQQREKIEELQNTRTEYRQYIMSEFGNLYGFLKGRREELLGQLQEQNKSLLEEMEPNAAKLKKCRDFIIETMAVCKQKTYEIDPFSFLDGIKEFLEKCREQKKLLPHNQVTEKELCRATFSGPLQYFAWKQMKSIVPVPECEEQPVTLKQEEVHESPMDQEPTSIAHSGKPCATKEFFEGLILERWAHYNKLVTVCHLVANTHLSEMERPERDTAKNNSTVAECEQQLVTVREAPTAGALRRYGKDGTRRTLWGSGGSALSSTSRQKTMGHKPQKEVRSTGGTLIVTVPGANHAASTAEDKKASEQDKTSSANHETSTAKDKNATKQDKTSGASHAASTAEDKKESEQDKTSECPQPVTNTEMPGESEDPAVDPASPKDSECPQPVTTKEMPGESENPAVDSETKNSECPQPAMIKDVFEKSEDAPVDPASPKDSECPRPVTFEEIPGPSEDPPVEPASPKDSECPQPIGIDKASGESEDPPENAALLKDDEFPQSVKIKEMPKEVAAVTPALRKDSEVKQIWIVGNAYICRAARQAKSSSDCNLGFEFGKWNVHWLGRVAMRWEALLPELRNAIKQGVPHVMFLHLGDNDLGCISYDQLTIELENVLSQLTSQFPNTEFVFSTILPRAEWLASALEQTRQDVNAALARYADELGFIVVKHEDIEEKALSRFKSGGSSVISDSEYDLFVKSIRDSVEKAMLRVEKMLCMPLVNQQSLGAV